MIRTVFFFLLLCGSVLGQVSAVIEAPDKAIPGELVVLNSSKSKGDNHKWITPDGISTAQAGCTAIDSQVFFATPRVGSYTFYLIVTDKTAAIDYAKHTVIVGESTVPPDVPTDPPVVNPGQFEKLAELSKANSLKLNDAQTRANLAASLRNVVTQMKIQCANNQCPTLQGAQSQFVRTIEAVLLSRQRGSSRDVNWEEVWRIPNAKWIADAKLTTVAKYLEACDAIVKGLQ
jgi:hypothetical protein